MNNKILIGSIIAVAILVIVSFTSVVGYNSVESDVKISPLFNIRSSRAVDEDGKDLTCDYVGKGEENVLSIPKRDTQQYMLGKLINMIGKMDDKTYDRFVQLVKKINIVQNSKINDNEIEVIPAPATIYFLRPICLTLYFFIAIPVSILITILLNSDMLCELAGLPTFN
jgi:hypothetical protein